ncbi:MAG: transglutaminase domain-containing protein [Allomuricauda sp.]
MTKYLLIFFLLFSLASLKANSKYEEIDKQSKSVPDSLKTVEEIAEYLTLNLKNEDEKARAFYIWITHNIKYDLSKINSTFHGSYDKMVNETIELKKGVCEHYSQLFHYLCKSVGIESFVISGYTREKGSNEISELNHAWNGVEIDGDYLFIDNTFAAGYLDYRGNYIHEFSDTFFLISPKDFIRTHVPFDPVWQFLENPISHLDFKNKDFSKLNKIGSFNYKDSISANRKLDSIIQIKKKIQRIEKSGITHYLIRNYVNESEEQIETLIYDKWILTFNEINEKANKAKDEINIGIGFNNTFIDYLNKRFRNPKIGDTQIKSTIEKANLHFYRGKDQLKKLKSLLYELEYAGKSTNNLKATEKHKQELIDFIVKGENKILEVEPSILKNTDYSKRYLKTWKPLRSMVPY